MGLNGLLDSKNIVKLVVGIIVGVFVGYGASNFNYTRQINEINTELNNLESQYMGLSLQYDAVSDEYDTVKDERDSLQILYSSLSSEHSTLQSNYESLSLNYEKVSGYFDDVADDFQEIIEMLVSYHSIPEAFKRVINNEELEKIASTVSSVTEESTNNWYAYEQIYRHVAFRVEYTPDVEFPYIADYRKVTMNGKEIMTGFTVDTTMNYIQTPEFTLEHEQGDVEDQVIAAYAMLKYYENNIYETEYPSYIADIKFSDGFSHLAIFLPVKGGRTRITRLCILDPAGQYYTNKYGSITQRDVPTELDTYAKTWSKKAGDITHITFYDVDATDGSYEIIATGNLLEIAEFFDTE